MFKFSKAALRKTPCSVEQELEIMIQLRNENVEDVEPWIEEYQRITTLPEGQRLRTERYYLELIKPMKFCRQAGHRMFNEAFTEYVGGGSRQRAVGPELQRKSRTSLYKNGVELDLGLGAAWCGLRIFLRAVKRSTLPSWHETCDKCIVRSMANKLFANLSGKDQEYVEMLFGHTFRGKSAESLEKWLYKVS